MPPSPLTGRRLRAAAALAVLSVPAQAAAAPSTAPLPTASVAGFRAALGLPGASAGPFAPAARTLTPADRRRNAHARVARKRASRVQRRIGSMKSAGDRITHRPYVYGGGHGSFDAAGYDCSGSVSYVLHAAGLLDAPMASGGLMSYGRPGRGKHVTIYANGGHVFMVVDGRRFDTIAFKQSGTRWSSTVGDTSGYVVRHPAGL